MNKAQVLFDKNFCVGDIDKRLAGSFIEHLGNCLYNGVYEPGHPSADKNGFRNDVKALIKELGVSAIRYPGGNFVSGYNWKDGIGPKENRPAKKELAWNVIETNQVGVNEFAAFLKDIDVELILAVNLGTGTPAEAGELADYCNTDKGTYWSDLRRSHGVEKPHNVELWCMGNEMDGEWQIAALTAWEYARKAKEAAKIVKWTDKNAKSIFCGTCTNEIGHKTFGEWDRTVLEEAYDYIDYLSLHRYFNYNPQKQLAYKMYDTIDDIPFFFRDLQDYLDTIIAACDFIKGKNRKEKSINISFDEWGVVTDTDAVPGGVEQQFSYAKFSQLDAVIYGGLLCTFLNNADRVKIACQSLLVNAGGMISTAPGGKAIRQATFYPFKDVANLAKGKALRPVAKLPTVVTPHHGEQENVIIAASCDEQNGSLQIFVSNCDLNQDCELSLQLNSFENIKAVSHKVLYHDDKTASNTFDNENAVLPKTESLRNPVNGKLTVSLKKHSWNVLSFKF